MALVSFSIAFSLYCFSSCLFLCSLSFFCLSVSLSSSSLFHFFSFSLIYWTHVLSISQLFCFLFCLSRSSSLSWFILFVSSTCCLKALSQSTNSTSSSSPYTVCLGGSMGSSVSSGSGSFSALAWNISLMSVLFLFGFCSVSMSSCLLFFGVVFSGAVGDGV